VVPALAAPTGVRGRDVCARIGKFLLTQRSQRAQISELEEMGSN
jgi:hypothetical protein